jgi:hypothetical protein
VTVTVGVIVRVERLSNSHDFTFVAAGVLTFVAAGVLLPLGLWLLLGSQPIPRERPRCRGACAGSYCGTRLQSRACSSALCDACSAA